MSSRADTTEVGTEPHAPQTRDGRAADAVAAELGRILRPWYEVVAKQIPELELFDAHTPLGQNDPDGMRQQPEELLDGIAAADARGAFVFAMHEPDGYPAANDMVL